MWIGSVSSTIFRWAEGFEDEVKAKQLDGFRDEVVHAGFVAALYMALGIRFQKKKKLSSERTLTLASSE